MKRPYTIYNSAFQKAVKMSGRGEAGFMDVLSELVKHPDVQESNNAKLMLWIATMIDTALESAVHVFIKDAGFCDWLVSCVPVLTSELASCAVEKIGAMKICVKPSGAKNIIDFSTPIIFHFPCDSGLRSIAVSLSEKFLFTGETEPCAAIAVNTTNSTKPKRWIPGGADYCLMKIGEIKPNDPELEWGARLALGVGMYISCFPEMLKPGPPEDLKHPSFHKYPSSCNLEISPKVAAGDGHHASPCGHFRRGHFRLLSSEKFTKKRFEIVFVRQSFVGGVAKTILEPESANA